MERRRRGSRRGEARGDGARGGMKPSARKNSTVPSQPFYVSVKVNKQLVTTELILYGGARAFDVLGPRWWLLTQRGLVIARCLGTLLLPFQRGKLRVRAQVSLETATFYSLIILLRQGWLLRS